MKAIAAALLFVAAACTSTTPHGDVRAHAIRLGPGDDLRARLEQFARDEKIEAGFVMTCAGSLRRVAIRFADAKDATMLDGPFEIVSLSGTFSGDGPHLHISVSDATGRTIGGHLGEGSIVYTTAEVVIGEIAGTKFSRVVDPVTTFRELKIE